MNAPRGTSSLKLGTRLSLAFLSVIGLTLVVSAFALFQLVRINAHTDDIATNWLPTIAVLGDIRATSNQIRRAEADHLMAFDEKTMAELETLMTDTRARQDKFIAKYESLLANDEERRLYAEFKAHREAYFATSPKLMKLSHGGEKTFEEAKTFFRGESRNAFNAAMADIGKLVELNIKGSDTAYDEARQVYSSSKFWLAVLVLAAVSVAAVLTWAIVRSVQRQLGGDPIEVAAVVEAITRGDLTARVPVRAGDKHSVIALMATMQESLVNVVSRVRSGSEGVATASAQIAQGNNDLSSRTEEQASALEQTAASMEQLTATVKQNSDNARAANQLAKNASTVAIRGGDVVSQVVDTMKGINESSRKISDIISVIDGIAFQTNILALNAAVEAARAGEQGRGFAVVASEVRSLAGRSAEAAKEIKSLINASVERVGQGSALVDTAGTTMTEVVDAIKRVTDLMGEISEASNEQASGVTQVGDAVVQMDHVTQQNAALVEEMAAAAGSLSTQARELVQTVEVFKLSHSLVNAATRIAPTTPAALPAATRPAPRKLAAAPARPAPAAPPQLATAAAGGNGDWENF